MKTINISKDFNEKLYNYASHSCSSFKLSTLLNPCRQPVEVEVSRLFYRKSHVEKDIQFYAEIQALKKIV